MGEGAARVLSRADRRSAGLGSDGRARPGTHAVGVRGQVRLPRATRICTENVSFGNHRRSWTICAGGGHRIIDVAKICK